MKSIRNESAGNASSITNLKQDSVIRAFLIILGVYLFFRFSVFAVQPPGMIPNDYLLLHTASQNRIDGHVVYNPNDASPYKYSPTFLLFFEKTIHPFLQFKTKFEGGFKVHREYWPWLLWSSFYIFLLIFSLWKLWLPREEQKFNARFLAGLFFALIAGWHGLLELFSYGQVDILIFSFFLFSVWLEEDSKKKNTYFGSFFAAFHFLIKPQSAILWSYFLIRKKNSWILRTLGMSVVLFFLPILFWGSDVFFRLIHEWIFTLKMHHNSEFLISSLNHNPLAVFSRYLLLCGVPVNAEVFYKFGEPLLILAALGFAFVLRGQDFSKKSSPEKQTLLASVCFFLYQLCTPLSWRWLTFAWMPWVAVVCWQKNFLNTTFTRWIFGIFAVIVLLLQKNFSQLLGISEIDVLSKFGFYFWGNLALFLLSVYALKRNSRKTL